MDFLEVWPVLAFLAVQTVAAVWWAATISARVAVAERAETINQRLDTLDEKAKEHQAHGTSIARFEEVFVRLEKRIEELLAEWRESQKMRRR